MEILIKLFQDISAESEKAGADALTKTATSGDQTVAVKVDGYVPSDIRKLIAAEFKAGDGAAL